MNYFVIPIPTPGDIQRDLRLFYNKFNKYGLEKGRKK